MMILSNKVKNNVIDNNVDLDSAFNYLINNLKLNYSHSNNTTLLEVLKDYYNAKSMITNTNTRDFNYFIFIQLMSKVKSIGILKLSIEKTNFLVYKNYLIKEISLDDIKVSRAFDILLSRKMILQSTKISLKKLNNYWGNYLEIFVNLHQYTKSNIDTNIRIANSFLDDFVNDFNDNLIESSAKSMNSWLMKHVHIYKQIYKGKSI